MDGKQTGNLERYRTQTSTIVENLLKNGAFIPRNRSNKSIIKPTWWNDSCDERIKHVEIMQNVQPKKTLEFMKRSTLKLRRNYLKGKKRPLRNYVKQYHQGWVQEEFGH